jgi:hypothetical protein
VLAVDPMQYPDENPLLDKRLDQPSATDIADAEKALASSEPTAPGDSSQESGVSVVPVLIGVGIGVIVLILVAVVVTVIIIRRNNRTQRKGQS